MERTRICTIWLAILAVGAAGVYAAPASQHLGNSAAAADVCDFQRTLAQVVDDLSTASTSSTPTLSILDWQRLLDATTGEPAGANHRPGQPRLAQQPNLPVSAPAGALPAPTAAPLERPAAAAACPASEPNAWVSAKDRFRLGLTPHAPPSA